MNIKTVIGHKSAYSVSMLRMILFPILTYVVMKIINVDFEVRATAVILAAMPSGSLNVIMAQKYKNNIEFAINVVIEYYINGVNTAFVRISDCKIGRHLYTTKTESVKLRIRFLCKKILYLM